ncbi:MAG: nitronate monooxygenase [Firmicutes bacterium]|nr:nitronate monooxygenase [Bacillota bacterium]
MKLPQLDIGNLLARFPIVQGGMAVRISTAPLAAAVAEAGGVGTIAGTGMSVAELRQEIKKARQLTAGIIGVNVLFAVRNFAQLIKASMEEGIDFIVTGAGFSRDMFTWGRKRGVPIIPIVSSARLGKLAERLGAAALVVEGVEAGGHLGTDRPLREILPEVREAVDLPLIAAGGIADGRDAAEMFVHGASGVQLGTRFIASVECTAPQPFKEMCVNTRPEDIVLIDSPVGMPGRAVRNELTEALLAQNPPPIVTCDHCLKRCSRRYCILDVLNKAQRGDVKGGLVFSGISASKIKEILPVAEIIKRLIKEVEGA